MNVEDARDVALAVFFPAPHSFTGEDVAELHLHGGRLLMKNALRAVIDAGAEPATAGEFTRTAFLNGKLALADAEGIADMINADSEAALRAAYRLLSGELSGVVGALQEKLLMITAEMEVAFDYPDEFMDEIDLSSIEERLNEVRDGVRRLLSTGNSGKLVRDGVCVAIVGNTNAGKSSLLNKILKFERAIVSDVAGTTRDTVEESVIYRGVKLNLIDTAGIRESEDRVESIGIERSRLAANSADCILLVIDGSKPLEKSDEELISEFSGERAIICVNKSDLGLKVELDGINISALTGDGVEDVLDAVLERFNLSDVDATLITDVRHEAALKRAEGFLSQALLGIGTVSADCLAVDVRGAYFALGEITGNTASEEITNTVFEKFCVGK